MKPSILNSTFLIFFIILVTKSPFNNSKNTELHEIVTDSLVHKICPQTRNPNLCMYILNQYKGKPLYPKPLAGVMSMAEKNAKTTAKRIFRLKNGLTGNESEQKLRYLKCFEKLKMASGQLKEANKFLNAGNLRSVQSYTSVAMTEVRSCDEELAKLQQHQPSDIARDNRKLQELCSILYVMCDKVVIGRRYNEIKG